MKCQVPQISWHGRDPVLSIDFQPNQTDVFRLASGGTDSHVVIWYVTYQENKSVKIEFACDLTRHSKSVNVVRFSPSGEFLASGDDEGAMFIWKLKEKDQLPELPNDDENINKEDWYPVKLLRKHLDDIYDICWSKDGNFLVSSSMDNTAIMWDMVRYTKIHMFSDFKGYVQGVTWDPCNQFIASVGSDRSLRIHNINSKKVMHKVSKAPWTNSTEKGTFKAKLFYDDTLQSYFRRLTFTPDGELLIVPSGIVEKGEKITNTCYVFSRHAFNKPVISLPTMDKYTVAVRCNPFLYKLRCENDSSKDQVTKPMICLPYRMVFAVAASDSVLLYDTEQVLPFAYVSNIHYTHLTDLSWSSDGLTLAASSTDGYCSFILFTREELGEIYIPEPKDVKKESEKSAEASKNETNQTAGILTVSDSDNKNISAPNTPKHSVPAPVKSPKPNSGTKDECVTPSTSKVVKLVTDSKKVAKKSPKTCSILKFLTSPKTVSSTSAVGEDNSVYQLSDKKENAAPCEIQVIELSDSPIKTDKTSSTNPSNAAASKGENEKLQDSEDVMDVDENPAESICTDKLQSSPNSSGKHSKCNIRLNFADKGEFITSIDDNAIDSNSVAASAKDLAGLSELAAIEENENDWKLELSQDEDIPMEVTPSVPENKSEEPKMSDVNSLSKNTSVPQLAINGQKTPESKTPRRVSFITLSSKSNSKK